MANPSRISYTETTSWHTTGTSKSIASISWQVGDVLIRKGMTEGAGVETIGVPTNTGTGLSWALVNSVAASSHCAASIYACVATIADSGVISTTNSSGTSRWGFAVSVWRGSAGVGNNAVTAAPSTTKTVNLTPTAAGCAVEWVVADWSAETAHALTPTPTGTDEATQFAGYSAHAGYLVPQASAGAVAYGITGGTSTGPYTIAVVEVKAGAGGATPDWLPRRGSFGQDANLRRRNRIYVPGLAVPTMRDIQLCERSKRAA